MLNFLDTWFPSSTKCNTVRSLHPMINGDDGVHDHTALNTHSMNDDAHEHDESIDDDVFACERDPKDHRRWRRTRFSAVESTNVNHLHTPVMNP